VAHAEHSCHAQVKDYALVNTAIIGWYSSLGAWSRVEGSSVLGEDVQVKVGCPFCSIFRLQLPRHVTPGCAAAG
jgi:hypothetical protein